MPLALIAGSALALGASAFDAPSGDGAAMFEQVELADGLSLVTYGVLKDTRCRDPELCFQAERLVVGTVINWRGLQREAALEMGVPMRFGNGWIVLDGSDNRPRENGATPLPEYRFSYSYFE